MGQHKAHSRRCGGHHCWSNPDGPHELAALYKGLVRDLLEWSVPAENTNIAPEKCMKKAAPEKRTKKAGPEKSMKKKAKDKVRTYLRCAKKANYVRS